MQEKNFYDVNDVSVYMGISVPMAYKIIRKLNNELSDKGYITVSGKVNRIYFEEKIYAGCSVKDGVS